MLIWRGVQLRAETTSRLLLPSSLARVFRPSACQRITTLVSVYHLHWTSNPCDRRTCAIWNTAHCVTQLFRCIRMPSRIAVVPWMKCCLWVSWRTSLCGSGRSGVMATFNDSHVAHTCLYSLASWVVGVLSAVSAVAYPGIVFVGVQQIQLRSEDRENGDLGSVVP